VAALRGHRVTLYEASGKLGGQMNLSKAVPGKEEFNETIRFYTTQLNKLAVTVKLNRPASADELVKEQYDHIVLATGIVPRIPDIEGIHHKKVLGYPDVLLKKRQVGKKVAIIGGGGIGFDVAMYLSDPGFQSNIDNKIFMREWGIEKDYRKNGGLVPKDQTLNKSPRMIYMLKRSPGKFGSTLGKTTGWIHRATLKERGIIQMNGVDYKKIDDSGLHIRVKGETTCLDVDHIIICAGQLSHRELLEPLKQNGCTVTCIGGAAEALELDAKQAIAQGCRLGAAI
jgi:2,4-dienoyl-CoA reductase (NADPH2)